MNMTPASPEKSFSFHSPEFRQAKFILMDVEGTTSDIHFVKEVLFPTRRGSCVVF